MTVVRRDLEAHARTRFLRDTEDHEMTIIRDDAEMPYRHVRFRKPGTSIYYYDLITWPGHLTIAGDCGTFVFARIYDMFEFFDGRDINPHYWSEKLQAPKPDAVEVYSYEALQQRLDDWYKGHLETSELTDEDRAGLLGALKIQILDNSDIQGAWGEHEAHRLLADFEYKGHVIYDSWEWSLRHWDYQFLWCCWAVLEGVRRYKEAKNG